MNKFEFKDESINFNDEVEKSMLSMFFDENEQIKKEYFKFREQENAKSKNGNYVMLYGDLELGDADGEEYVCAILTKDECNKIHQGLKKVIASGKDTDNFIDLGNEYLSAYFSAKELDKLYDLSYKGDDAILNRRIVNEYHFSLEENEFKLKKWVMDELDL